MITVQQSANEAVQFTFRAQSTSRSQHHIQVRLSKNPRQSTLLTSHKIIQQTQALGTVPITSTTDTSWSMQAGFPVLFQQQSIQHLSLAVAGARPCTYEQVLFLQHQRATPLYSLPTNLISKIIINNNRLQVHVNSLSTSTSRAIWPSKAIIPLVITTRSL